MCIRDSIEYGFAEADTTYGKIGVKVWIYKGEVLSQTLRTTPRTMDTSRPPRERRQGGNRPGGYNNNRQGGYNNNRQGGYNNNRQGGYNNNRPGGQTPREGGTR